MTVYLKLAPAIPHGFFREVRRSTRRITSTLRGQVNRQRLERIIEAVANDLAIPSDRISSRDRHFVVADARHLVYWLARELYDLSYKTIGRAMPGRFHPHCTVLCGIRSCKNLIETNPDWRARSHRLLKTLSQTLPQTSSNSSFHS